MILGNWLMKTIDWCGKNPSDTVSSRTVTPSTPAKRPRSGSRTVGLKSYHGQHSCQTSVPLNTSGNSPSRGWESTQTLPEGSWSFGRGRRGRGGGDTSLKVQGFGGEHA